MEPVNLSQTIGAAEADMRVEELAKWDSTLSVVIIRGTRYFIGSHLAELLKRETFNLYGSLKRRNIVVYHADEPLFRLLMQSNIVYIGTTSISLIKEDDVSEFVTAGIESNRKREAKRTAPPPPKKPSVKSRPRKRKQRKVRQEEVPRAAAAPAPAWERRGSPPEAAEAFELLVTAVVEERAEASGEEDEG